MILAALFGLVAAGPWGRRAGIVLGAVVSRTGCWTWSCIGRHADPARERRRPASLRFGLWKAPTASILVELALVVAGAWLYWRAAVQTSTPDTRRTHLLGLLVLDAGVVTLALDAVVA